MKKLPNSSSNTVWADLSMEGNLPDLCRSPRLIEPERLSEFNATENAEDKQCHTHDQSFNTLERIRGGVAIKIYDVRLE
ncbi:hypothetical protein C5167_022467 [Papaver somniferum]|uniref:Uncharacterized protein n=1 Tax=Papaver somniferum TaxID=3469 RepID=A0A4Y7JI25_PAPSO|nr:hypothetical protein C5167_022467 [Papaver somniferum]